MNKPVLQSWIYYRWLTGFFADFSTWRNTAASLAPLLGERWGALTQECAEQQYDDLFKGTDAAVYIPLWASACAGKGDVICDATTLEVIRFYYEWGYRPINMDGNPPDFIGEQLRFLAYLSACSLHEPDNVHYEAAKTEFTNRFLLDTAKTVCYGVRKYAADGLFTAVTDALLDVAAGKSAATWTDDQWEFAEKYLEESDDNAVYKNGRLTPVPLGGQTVINTAGRNNCGGKCPLRATVQENCVLYVSAGDNENFPQIKPCIRGRGYRHVYLTGRRLRYPMKRIGERGEGKFKRISWDEAAEHVANEFARIRDTYGPASRYINYSTGISAVMRPDNCVKRLLSLDGGYLESYNTYSSACSYYTTPFIYGDVFSGNSIPDVVNTKLLILWGHNPTETNFGPERNYYLAQAKANGVRIIVVDPRYSDTALTLADEWIGIKPSTDGALADAMAYAIWSEGLYDRHFMDTYCLGFDEAHMPDGIPAGNSYEVYLFGKKDGVPKTPEWAEEITGIPAETIIRLAREYATTKPACLLPGYGMQRIGNGEQTTRSLALLACLTGNIGMPGGSAAGYGGVLEHPKPAMPIPQNPVTARIPIFMWTKAIEYGKTLNKRDDGLEGADSLDSDVKMMLNLAGNTLINQHSDINDTIRILKDTSKCEFILCSDVAMTPSAKFADILLPGTSFLEGDNMTTPWGFGSYLLFNNKVIEPLFGCRFEYEFLRDVAERLGHLEKFEDGHKNIGEWLEDIYNKLRKRDPGLPEFEVFKRDGGYKFKNEKPYIAYEKQIQNPESHPFSTPSGKIEIFSRRLYEMDNPQEIPAIPKYVPCPEGPHDPLKQKYPLQFIGWHTKRSTHSTHYGCDWMDELEPHRLWINPQDAQPRGISDGDLVEVFNDRGRTRVTATVTERVIKGVVAMPQGAWYAPDKDSVDTAGSINMLTAFRPTPLAKGNPQHTNLVEIVKETSDKENTTCMMS